MISQIKDILVEARLPGNKFSASAFTLIELLVVIVILGAITMVAVPQIGAGISGGKLATASQSLIHGAKYARTMALMNQVETELILSDGKIRVETVGGKNAQGGLVELSAEAIGKNDTFKIRNAADFSEEEEPKEEVDTRSAAKVTAEAFSEGIKMEYPCKEVSFRFVGFNDNVSSALDKPLKGLALGTKRGDFAADLNGNGEENPEIRVRFRSNGTCRPFTIRIFPSGENGEDDDGDYLDVDFDLIGSGRIRRDEKR